MLIDFKIRALFIWTDPYLPDLVYVNSGVTCNTYLRYIADWRSAVLEAAERTFVGKVRF